MAPFDLCVGAFRPIDFDVYLDDITISKQHKKRHMVELPGPAAEGLVKVIEDDLRCSIAPGKVGVAASDDDLAKYVAGFLPGEHGDTSGYCLLGCDLQQGRFKRKRKQEAISLRAGARFRKVRRIFAKASGARAFKLFVSGIKTAV